METISKAELLAYMRRHRLVVIGTISAKLDPESAYVGVAVTDKFEVIFDTVSTTRKHRNLVHNPRIAVTYCGPGEETLQYEGIAFAISTTAASDAAYRDIYYATWPECREHTKWAGLVYWAVKPVWARYSDYNRGPLIQEFHW